MYETRQKLIVERWNAWALIATMIVMSSILTGTVSAQESGEKTFVTMHEASTALYEAAKAGDKATLEVILGASSAPILSSGDPVQDQKNLDSFIRRYEQMNRWGKELNGDQTLFLGAENWPFPIPLKKDGASHWYFDTKAGVEEVLYRRIGNNEYAAIRVSGVLADAQVQYFDTLHDGATVHQYAQKFLSDPGKQNGLYWKSVDGESESPIGPLIAYATGEGYEDKTQSFHGYFYRILTTEGAAAPAATKSYLVDGKMTGGFAFVGYPRSTGTLE